MSDSLFELLRNKSIIAILDGDTEFGELENDSGEGGCVKISMPYLSGPMLCDISNRFGLAVKYSYHGGAKSRWEYMDDLMCFCIRNNRMSELLSYLFSKERFSEKLRNKTVSFIESAYSQITNRVIDEINGLLYFGGHKLNLIGGQFIVSEIGKSVKIDIPKINIVDRKYISDLSERALKNVMEEDFDSAITKSRTLLEEVFCYVIERKGETPSNSGDINRLYSQVKDLYNMHANHDVDRRINMLLSGLEKILTSIAQMRNEASDSHGVGLRRINISEYHARLFVNAATTMADFILSVSDNQIENA